MSTIIQAFTFHGEKKKLLEFQTFFFKLIIDNPNEIDEYGEDFNDQGNLIVYFDSFNTYPMKYVDIAMKNCPAFGIDFNCTLLNSWEFGEFYCICTFRHKDGKLLKFELKDKHYKKVKFKEDESIYTFNGVDYDDSDVPGILCEDMIKYFYGEELFKFPLSKVVKIDSTVLLNENEVKIGKQIWMRKDLRVDKFRNGDLIPEAKTIKAWKLAAKEEKPAWCYYKNDPTNGQIYGKLYNWYAVNDDRGLAPEGWHVPSDDEWSQLEDSLGEIAGAKMKAFEYWDIKPDHTTKEIKESGFDAIPGRMRDEHHDFVWISESSNWWSTTELMNDFEYNHLEGSYAPITYRKPRVSSRTIDRSDEVYRKNINKINGLSVRCVKD